MELIITKEDFDAAVPAFRSPTKDVFNKMQATIDTVRLAWEDIVAPDATLSPQYVAMIKQAVCLRAAYIAVPQLDLVLTATGFGIVSNQNTAPASRERVDSLREQLRQEASIREDNSLEALADDAALREPATIVDSLLWTPRICRSHGVTTPDHARVFREEKERMAVQILNAEERVKGIISPELYEALVREQRDCLPHGIERCTATIMTRRAMAAYINQTATSPNAHALERALLNYVQEHTGDLPEYANSRTAAAQNLERYDNDKDDSCFFFG